MALSVPLVSFEKMENRLKIPFVIYAHFDSFQIPEEENNENIIHKPSGFAYSIKCTYDDSLSTYEEYIGEDSPNIFWEKIELESRDIAKKLRCLQTPQALIEEEKLIFEKIQICYFCNNDLEEDKCQVFYPLTGKFLGAGHRNCTQKCKIPQTFIPVIMDHLGKYAKHFLLKELPVNGVERSRIFEIGKNQGFRRQYPWIQLRFLDSQQFFTNEKIPELAKFLEDDQKKNLKNEFKEHFDFVKEKIIFPYYYMKGFEKLRDENLPDRDGFFDQLHEEEISVEDYKKCSDVWVNFECKTMEDYFSIYLKSSVFLLEDIFENFRNLCLEKYCLDPAYYYTIATFSWDSMLRYTGVTLQMLTEKSMIDFFKSNIRGGMVQCSKRHAKANNKYNEFDESKPSTFIVYLDANNLGGWAMSQKLPFSDFNWLGQEEIDELFQEILNFDENGDFGFVLEVDLDYPKDLHELHNDLPFCVDYIPLSPWSEDKKQSLNFYPKTNYITDYRTLKQCLNHGLILKKIHRVLKFKQTKWLEPYISYNTSLRAEARNDFETKLYKLLNNSIFGKTIQRTAKDKPLYAGFCILELCKKFMYDFHYNHMVPKYQDKLNLLYIDTDGVIYEIQTSDYFEDLKSDPEFLEFMDTSNLDDRWEIPSKNKKALGKMKDEYGGKIIREFFGVGAKFYFLDIEGEEVKKAAGVKKYVKNKYIGRKDYEDCVLKGWKIYREGWETDHTGDVVLSKKMRKVVLSPGDKKRIILDDKIRTTARGFLE